MQTNKTELYGTPQSLGDEILRHIARKLVDTERKQIDYKL